MSFTELSQVHILKQTSPKAATFWQATKWSVAAFLSKACEEKL